MLPHNLTSISHQTRWLKSSTKHEIGLKFADFKTSDRENIKLQFWFWSLPLLFPPLLCKAHGLQITTTTVNMNICLNISGERKQIEGKEEKSTRNLFLRLRNFFVIILEFVFLCAQCLNFLSIWWRAWASTVKDIAQATQQTNKQNRKASKTY